ncbi:hypothetical protein Tco_0817228 [Tanacetum coccineum]
MRIDELHKFSDGTLNDIRSAFDDILKRIWIEYLPQTVWRNVDRERAGAMIQAIDRQLRNRSWKHVKEDSSSKLNLSDHKVDPHRLKMGWKVPDSSDSQDLLATCSYRIDKHKDFMKGSNTYFKSSLL